MPSRKKITLTQQAIDDLYFELPPEEGGQYVQTSYAFSCEHDCWILRTTDHSDRSVTYSARTNREADVDNLCVGANGAPATGAEIPLVVTE